jgi:tRNA-dihydrouridine synthase B
MSFSIGPIQIDEPVFLAPMSGISDLPFRRIVMKFGAGLVFSEMIASRAVLEEHNTSLRSTEIYDDEFDVAVQIAGCEPDIMAEAAKVNEDRGASIIDINFGCPVKKIVKKYAGSALMKDEKLAGEIMEATVKAVSVPVTVKMRLGWDEENLNAPVLAKMAEDIGIKMVTVHGRTRNQMYNGSANWDAVKKVREAIDLPLVVNGDILSPQDAKKAMDACSADGVMIGRGCQGKPWLLKQTMDFLKTGKISATPSKKQIYSLILEHYDAILEYYGSQKGVPIARKHISWYCSGMDKGNDFRKRINKEKDPEIVKEMLTEFYAV